MNYNGNKTFRILAIYERLLKGEGVTKKDLADEFCVTEKTAQRDIEDLRAYLFENHEFENEHTVVYDKSRKCYVLAKQEREWLTSEEVLAVSKIILESRAFNKTELNQVLSKLMAQVTPSEKPQVNAIVKNERLNYIPLKHGKNLLHKIWELSELVSGNIVTHISYVRQDLEKHEYDIKPVAVMFSEFYFYLIAFKADGSRDFPTIFRVDRICEFNGTGEKFSIPYKDRFSDGEFRKRIQLMYGGPLRHVKFTYTGNSVEAILDKLPTAKILSKKDGIYTITAEVYGNGIDFYLKSQGENVEVIS